MMIAKQSWSGCGLRPRWPALLLAAFALAASVGRLAAAGKPDLSKLPAAANRPVDFARDVRPVFEKHCLQCHGPEKQKSDYRLDRKSEALKGGEHGRDIVPGKGEQSPLLHYVAGLVDEMVMPPKGDRLSSAEVALLRAWIDQGAVWPDGLDKGKGSDKLDWWSLRPLRKQAPPALNGTDVRWARNPVDNFVLAKLREKGLGPSPEADRRTLVRRLYFDLIGLPPSPEEVDSFVLDNSPQAYEALVERLLGSKQYGERWARHWLDVVHYGDTQGYDKDQPRPNAWPYRDYVIRAFNDDKPYGRFVKEQLAGDAMFPGDPDAILATGFISAGPWDLIGHAEVPESKLDGRIARNLDRDDMVSNTMNTFTSMTVQCARCHNHKFDPVTQEDYYSLQAVFAALDRADRKYDADPEVARARARLTGRQKELMAARKQLEEKVAALGGTNLVHLDKRIEAEKKAVQAANSDAVGYHSEIAAKQDAVKWVQVDLGQTVAVDRIVLAAAHDDFAGIGDGFGFPPRFKIELSNDPEFKKHVALVADRTAADFVNPGVKPQTFPASGIMGRYARITATKLALRSGDYIFALAELLVLNAEGKNLAFKAPVTSLDSIEAPVRWQKLNLVDGYYPGGGVGKPSVSDELPKLLAERQAWLDRVVDATTRSSQEENKKALDEVEKRMGELPKPSVVYAGTVHSGGGAFMGTGGNGGKPRVIRVLSRGDLQKPGALVGPGAVPILDGLEARFPVPEDHPEGERRVALANWITDPRNPLTWRSIVNRVWLYHFGRGIVDSPNDFGRMGQPPTHPELLDWLAVEFRDRGQSLKDLHRLMVTSSTYRQSSQGNESLALLDGNNQYLWRMNRRKLEAEAIRDSALKIAGKLDEQMYGPGYKDFVVEKPEHSPHYQYDLHDPEDTKSHRRSIYRFLVRSQPSPFMTTLDCADPSQMVDKRNETLTSLQALALLNNRFMLAMSGHMARRLAKSDATVPGQIDRAFRLALGRSPTPRESADLVAYAGEFGLANACRVVLNLNEFVFVD